jgi:hypothetical protein
VDLEEGIFLSTEREGSSGGVLENLASISAALITTSVRSSCKLIINEKAVAGPVIRAKAKSKTPPKLSHKYRYVGISGKVLAVEILRPWY